MDLIKVIYVVFTIQNINFIPGNIYTRKFFPTKSVVTVGLVPRVCEELFNSIESKKKPGINYEVSFSMLEIYNEKVRDLLNKKKTPHGGLKIKMSKDQGFHGIVPKLFVKNYFN